MKTAKWNNDTKVLYWKQKVNEQDMLETLKLQVEEARIQSKEEGKLEGKLKGEIKGEISQIKMGLEFGLDQGKVKSKLLHTKEKFSEIVNYFDQHPEDLKLSGNESPIGEELGLFGDIMNYE